MIKNEIRKISKKEFIKLKEKYLKYLKTFDIHYINGELIQNTDDYLTLFASEFDFPNYYGKNLSALADCLTDLDFRTEPGFIIIIYNYHKMLLKDSESKLKLEEVLKYVAYYLDTECLTVSGGRNNIKSFDVYLVDENIDI